MVLDGVVTSSGIDSTCRVAHERGFTVHVLSDITCGRTNLELEAVLSDMVMPKLDGEGCFGNLNRINQEVHVAPSSDDNEQEAVGRFTGKGLASFVRKPYRPEVFPETINKAISAEKI